MSTSQAHRPDDILKRAHAIGTYYGFRPLSALAFEKRGQGSKAPYPESLDINSLDAAGREVAGLLKHVRDAGLTPSTREPLFLWHTNAAPGRPAPKQVIVQFHVLGVEHAIADAVLIRAVRAFLHDLTKADARLRLNSMGDKETRSRFSRELGTFFRKYGATLPAECIECAKTDTFMAAEKLACNKESCGLLPSPTDHLSEASRKHFEAVLEYLETTETPYELAPELLSRGTIWSDTCFELSLEGGRGIEAWGSRYGEFNKHFFKSSIPSVGAVIRIATENRNTIPSIKEKTSPRFVFVHIGDEAKRVSMQMADDLRRARIPLTQAIGIASLTDQMRFADSMNPPYLLIMGRKEALERSVILRERASYTESIIPLDSLIDRLKAVA